MAIGFSRFTPDSLLGRVLRLPLRLVPKRAVVTVRSGLNKGLRWVVGTSIHGCWLGHYEIEKQDWVHRLVKPGMNVLDVGANAGFYTLAFSRLVGSAGHVWAFEPFAQNASNILRHLELNETKNVTLIQSAVASESGLSGFHIGSNNAMGAISESGADYLVPTVTLDALVESGNFPIPDVIKMDVEGAESRVLDGAMKLLASRKTSFLIALHGHQQMQLCLTRLQQSGYRVFQLDGQAVSPDGNTVDEICAVPDTETGNANLQLAASTHTRTR